MIPTDSKRGKAPTRLDPKMWRRIFGVLALVTAAIFLAVTGVLIAVYQFEILRTRTALLVGIAAVLMCIVLVALLDRSSRVEALCHVRGLDLKWVLVLPVALAVPLAAGAYYLIQADLAWPNLLDTNLDVFANRALLVYSAVTLLLLIPGFLAYFGVKNLRGVRPFHALKFGGFAAGTSACFVIALWASLFLYDQYVFPAPGITAGNGHDDGPWVTWDADPTCSACIAWLTRDPAETRLLLGTSPTDVTRAVTGSGEYLHKVHLSGLAPDTRYYYAIPGVTFEQDHPDPLFSFRTAPNASRPYTFLVYGDMQPTGDAVIQERNALVADALVSSGVQFDFFVQLGDACTHGGDRERWHTLFQAWTPVWANWPFMGTIGNHDWGGDRGANWAELFSYPFVNPGRGRYYSFDYLNAHLVMIDNFEHVYQMSGAQLAWIAQDVQAARARGQDWVFCFFHLAMLTSCTSGVYTALQAQLVPLFDQYAVDAVFFAHDHSYAHYNYTYGADGLLFDPGHAWAHHDVQYFLSGGGGANLEYDYGLLSFEAYNYEREYYNETAGAWQTITYQKRPWNASQYLDYTANPAYGPYDHGRAYYHDPREALYMDEMNHWGLQYAEDTCHYLRVDVDPAAGTATISARYPNGDLLAGPGGALPQMWTFSKLGS